MANDNTVTIDSVDQGRQALAALKGYQHQLYATALAWARLPAQAALLVEVAEDYAILVDQAVKAVQVKSGVTRPTLRVKDCVDFINAYWRLRANNPDRKVEALYLSTALAGRERGAEFPDGATGLDHWRSAAREGADVSPIRAVLEDLALEPSLRTWLQTASDDEVRHELLMPVHWDCGAPSTSDLEPLLIDAILDAGESRGLFATMQAEGDERAYLAGDLIVLAHLRTDSPIFAGDAYLSAILRFAQLRVAVFAETKNIVAILDALSVEAEGVEAGEDLRVAALGRRVGSGGIACGQSRGWSLS